MKMHGPRNIKLIKIDRNYSVSRLGAVFDKSFEFKAGVEFLA
jgi:hypothetical protein